MSLADQTTNLADQAAGKCPLPVLAVVVTHNRRALLERCLRSLREQTAPLEILVINNGCTDDTVPMLERSSVDYLSQGNLGSAGGWWRGISEAIARKHQYVWLMDDDGFPDARALEMLLAACDDRVSCVSSVVVKESDSNALVFGMPRLNRNGFPLMFGRPRKYYTLPEVPNQGGRYPHAHLFNGALLNLRVVEKVGNVDQSYFMYGDEVDYFYRLKKVGPIETVLAAKHFHPDVNQRPMNARSVYYSIRNVIILNHLYCDYALIRDFLTVMAALDRIRARNGWAGLVRFLAGDYRLCLYCAIWDGLRNNRLKRI